MTTAIVLKLFFIFTCAFQCALASLSLDSAEMKVLDDEFGTCQIKVIQTKPRSIDLDVTAAKDAKDVLLQFGIFTFVDGQYNELVETEKVSICNLSKSTNPLVNFMYTEMEKVGNLTKACPVLKGHYYVHGLTVYEKDVPAALPLPSGKLKLEVNGTAVKSDDSMVPLFELDILFTEKNE